MTKDGVVVVGHDLWLNPDIVRKVNTTSGTGTSTERLTFLAENKSTFIKDLSPEQLLQKISPLLIKNLTLAEVQSYDVGALNRNSAYANSFPISILWRESVCPH